MIERELCRDHGEPSSGRVLCRVLSRGNEQVGYFLRDDDWSDFISLRGEILNHFDVDVFA